jgi:hypothetical protein
LKLRIEDRVWTAALPRQTKQQAVAGSSVSTERLGPAGSRMTREAGLGVEERAEAVDRRSLRVGRDQPRCDEQLATDGERPEDHFFDRGRREKRRIAVTFDRQRTRDGQRIRERFDVDARVGDRSVAHRIRQLCIGE